MWKIYILFLVAKFCVCDNISVRLGKSRDENPERQREFSLSHNKLSELGDKVFLQLGFQGMTTILLNNNSISIIAVTSFLGLSRLKKLDLSDNNLTSIHPDTFAHNNKLNYLSLDGNKLFQLPEDRSYIFAKSLEFISLSNCNIQKITKRILEDMEKITFLDLSHNCINVIEPATFSPLKQLRELNISVNNFTSLSADILSEDCHFCIVGMCNASSTWRSIKVIVDGEFSQHGELRRHIYNFSCRRVPQDIPENLNSTIVPSDGITTVRVVNEESGKYTSTPGSENIQLSFSLTGIIIAIIVTGIISLVILLVVLLYNLCKKYSVCIFQENTISEQQNQEHQFQPLNQNPGIVTEKTVNTEISQS